LTIRKQRYTNDYIITVIIIIFKLISSTADNKFNSQALQLFVRDDL